MERREAIKWMLAAAGSALVLERRGAARPAEAGTGWVGYGGDPDLLRDYQPGELWPLSFSEKQRRCATALGDVILPADAQSPAASALGVPAFVDEWISAPYAWINGPETDPHGDRRVILAGLDWIDAEARSRFGQDFAGLIHSQQAELCDPICREPAGAGLADAARFFRRFRDLTMAGFYTTKEGMADLKYVGNVPQTSFAGPPPEVLRQAGLL